MVIQFNVNGEDRKVMVKAIEDEMNGGNVSPEIFKRHAEATKNLENAMSVWELAVGEADSLA